jgi:hypothetical protein
MVDVVEQDPLHYNFVLKKNYPIRPQIQAQMYTLAYSQNTNKLHRIVEKVKAIHQKEITDRIEEIINSTTVDRGSLHDMLEAS